MYDYTKTTKPQMKIAIMQPYFLPFIGYFSLINEVDEFILFDTPQFIRHGWIERNRILKQNGEPLYIKVPLKKHTRETVIKDLVINNSENWKDKILAQLVPYKKKAPYYWKVVELLKRSWDIETDSIVELNYRTLKTICQYLEIKTPIKIWSEMNIKIDEVNSPDEWALNICKALGANSYLNPIGGLDFFDKTKYENDDIEINFIEMISVKYNQFSNEFAPFLSILDVMMFNDVDEIKSMLNYFKLK